MYFFFAATSRSASRWLWLITVSTHAMDLRTDLLHAVRVPSGGASPIDVPRTRWSSMYRQCTHRTRDGGPCR